MPSWGRYTALLSFPERAAAGLIDGVSVVKKFGYNPNVTANSTVWSEGGLYQYLSAPQTVFIASTDANDADGDTGAHEVVISGLDENFLDYEETVTLNGKTAVETSGQFSRVFRMYVLSAGSSAKAEGIIRAGYGTFTAGVPANVLATINNVINQTLMAMYTVPADSVVFIHDYYSNSGKSGEVVVNSFVRLDGGVFRSRRLINLYESTFNFSNVVPFFFPPKTDIEIRASSTTGTPVNAGFDLIVIKQDKLGNL